jgi:hypothetical protein
MRLSHREKAMQRSSECFLITLALGVAVSAVNGTKKLILGAMVAGAAVCQVAVANASTYDVSFSFTDQTNDTITVTGNIVTTCDSCVLTQLNISNFSFSWNGPFSGSNSGTGANVGGFPANLSASGGIIQFISAPGFFTTFSDHSAVIPNVSFGESHPENCGAFPADINCITLFDASFNRTWGHVSLPFTIATEEVVGTTPLPAGLPLFASGLAGLGLLGWRRKKAAA